MRRFLFALIFVIAPSARGESRPLSAVDLAAKIDEHLAARWKERGVPPAPMADDATFLRRAHLDLIGRIPDLIATRDFLDDNDPAKREKLVTRLLAHPRYAGHWANVWRAWVVLDVPDNENPAVVGPVEHGLRAQLRVNTPYDRMVRELLLPSPKPGADPLEPRPFYDVHLNLPDRLAAATSRLFLGVKLECAQCHNHPFAKWTKKQFWEMAAFYSGMPDRERLTALTEAPKPPLPPGQVRVPDTDKVVKARYLDGGEARWERDPRESLVGWMVRKDNPWFARALVNRYWEHLFGTGLVEPVDEESADNRPSHPALLDLLQRQFVLHDYDLHYLLRAILTSRAYQLSSRRTHAGQDDPRLFARRRVSGMSAEQLYDSVAVASGRSDILDGIDYSRLSGDTDRRAEFRRRFPTLGKRTEQETSTLQALHLMNGELISKATRLESNRDLATLAESQTPPARRIEQMFLLALSRKPTAVESGRFARYVEGGGPSGQPGRAIRDVFWVLLNSGEFCSNH